MKVDAIRNGIVLDHIEAGKGMEIYNFLKLDELDCPVALIKNAGSKKMGKKDIIKIDADIKIDLEILGYIAPNVTVNIIKDGEKVDKLRLSLPETVKEVIKCKNPRCITSVEQGIEHEFRLVDREKGIYRSIYCEAKAK
ncbi:MAG: aspartate carbamoyltransferase regulatory subunit [Clostridia bacterium]|nr:aspartate carbamoyltransferase regulatory subunit [Clostridia bacterium]